MALRFGVFGTVADVVLMMALFEMEVNSVEKQFSVMRKYSFNLNNLHNDVINCCSSHPHCGTLVPIYKKVYHMQAIMNEICVLCCLFGSHDDAIMRFSMTFIYVWSFLIWEV